MVSFEPKLALRPGELESALPIVEEEFGLKWLQEQVARKKRHHIVVRAWNVARQAVGGGRAIISGAWAIGALLDVARLLRCAKPIPGYDTAIEPRLRDPKFEHLHYELQVASLSADAGYAVQFLPPNQVHGTRTPDLRISAAGVSYLAECKRKEPYEVSSFDYRHWPQLEKAAVELFQELNADYEVIVVALGPLEQVHIDPLLGAMRTAIQSQYEGGPASIKGIAHGLYFRRLPLPPPSPKPGIAVQPGRNRRGTRVANIYRGEDDLFYVRTNRGIWLYTVDSHRFGSVLASFNSARGQLQRNEHGVIFIDLDVSTVSRIDLAFFMESMGAAVRTCFTPAVNTRVTAVVLTASGILAPVTEGSDWWQFDPDTAFVLVQNPFYQAATALTIPPCRLL